MSAYCRLLREQPKEYPRLEDQQQGNAPCESCVFCLVPKYPHAKQDACRSSKNRKEQERPLGYPPCVLPGTGLVQAYAEKPRHAGDQVFSDDPDHMIG